MLQTDFSFIQSPPEVHANAAETLCTVTRNAPSPLATKLSSPRFELCYIFYPEYMSDFKSNTYWATDINVCYLFAVPFPEYLVMHWKTRSQNRALSTHCLCASPYWIPEDQ